MRAEKKLSRPLRFSFRHKTKKYLTRLFEATYFSSAAHDLSTTKGEENKSKEVCHFVLGATRLGRCFMGPIIGPEIPISVSLCSSTPAFSPLPLLFFLVALLTSCLVSSRLLLPGIVAVNSNDPKKEWLIRRKRAKSSSVPETFIFTRSLQTVYDGIIPVCEITYIH